MIMNPFHFVTTSVRLTSYPSLRTMDSIIDSTQGVSFPNGTETDGQSFLGISSLRNEKGARKGTEIQGNGIPNIRDSVFFKFPYNFAIFKLEYEFRIENFFNLMQVSPNIPKSEPLKATRHRVAPVSTHLDTRF